MTDAKQAGPDDPGTAATAGPAGDDPVARRKHVRTKVSKAAKIIFSNGAKCYNCLVLDESPDGVLVELGGFVTVPDEVIIQYSSGASVRAARRQTNGTKVGFQFSGSEPVSEETAKELQNIGKILEGQGLQAAAEALRSARFFDDRELRRVTEDAENAHLLLKAALLGPDSI